MVKVEITFFEDENKNIKISVVPLQQLGAKSTKLENRFLEVTLEKIPDLIKETDMRIKILMKPPGAKT